LGIAIALKMIPKEVMAEYREQSKVLMLKLKFNSTAFKMGAANL
jgi:hypothetical protein